MSGRWLSVDPLVHLYPSLSSYAYCGNNPIVNYDPDGRFFDTILDVGFLAYDVYDIVSTYASGSEVTTTQWAALGADAAATLVPFATGAGVAVRAASKVDDVVKAVKAVDKVSDAGKAMKRGKAAEKRVLKDMGLSKNTKKVTGTEGKSIPDAMTNKNVIEIKDTKKVSNTKQIRIQREAAKNAGKKHVVITGKNTKVSKNVEKQSKVIRREDLGPQ